MTSQQEEIVIPILRKAIADRMSNLQVTQGMLASAVGVSQGNLSRYLKNKGNINSKKIDAILRLLELHASYGGFQWKANFGNCVHCIVRDIVAYKKELKAQKKLEERKSHLPLQPENKINPFSHL
jgi:predicted transcriptional regulator